MTKRDALPPSVSDSRGWKPPPFLSGVAGTDPNRGTSDALGLAGAPLGAQSNFGRTVAGVVVSVVVMALAAGGVAYYDFKRSWAYSEESKARVATLLKEPVLLADPAWKRISSHSYFTTGGIGGTGPAEVSATYDTRIVSTPNAPEAAVRSVVKRYSSNYDRPTFPRDTGAFAARMERTDPRMTALVDATVRGPHVIVTVTVR